MNPIPLWFERSFDFSFPVELYPNLCVRLRGTPARLEQIVRGQSPERLRKKPTQKWSAQEQSGVAAASAEAISQLAERNREYEDRFGFIFVICASGKSSDEMLAILNSRIDNDPQTELRIAAEEQSKITRLRLEKLLNQ